MSWSGQLAVLTEGGYAASIYSQLPLNSAVSPHTNQLMQTEAAFEVISAVGVGSFSLTPADGDFALAAVSANGLEASERVYLYASSGLGALFRSFATDWRGWEGTRSWESLEGELVLRAWSDRTGHTFLTVSLEHRATPSWSLRVELVLEAGGLDALAASAEAFEQRGRRPQALQ